MKVLLKFTGSLLYPCIMAIILPLLLTVKAALWLVEYNRHHKLRVFAFPSFSIRLSPSHFSLPFKRYAAAIRNKATAFHW